MPLKATDPDVRFWSRVEIRDPDECWPWRGYRDRKGYGRVMVQRGVGHPGWRSVPAGRFALYLCHGVWPTQALHLCDNPPCCNPLHLYDGTAWDNSHDALERGRLVIDYRHRGRFHPRPT